MFSLTDRPIVPPPRAHARAGAFVAFEGKVRDHADGRSVLRLEYEAHPELAIAEGLALVEEAIGRYGLLEASVVHRTGTLEIGETAVLVEVAAAHRREAFAACEWIIDQLKVRVPIWKMEHYASGDSGWVGSDARVPDARLASRLFERQIRLEEVGPAGQAKLAEARVLLVGVGGLGSASLPYLAAAGIGTIGLADPDEVELSNLHRQVLYSVEEEGRLKVERAEAFARRLNPGLKVETYPVRVEASNVDALVASYDWVLDGTDSLATKFLLDAACRRQGKPLTTASVHRFEGHVLTSAPGGPCLQCLFPTIPPEACVGTCAEVGVLGLVPGFFGILQANEALKGLLGYGEPLVRDLLIVDLRTGESTFLARAQVRGCPGCQGHVETTPCEVEVGSIAEMRARFASFELIDLREPWEGPPLAAPHHRLTGIEPPAIEPDRPVLFVCAHGVRSLAAAFDLRERGWRAAFSLRGGTAGLSRDELAP